MRKRSYLLVLAAVFVAILVVPSVFISCSDDEKFIVSVDEDLLSNGFTAEMIEGIYTFKVKSNGKWVASLPDDCLWATLLTEEGYGDDQLTIVLEGNYTGISRTTILTLTCDDNTTNVTIRQNETIGGQVAENGTEYVELVKNKKLGNGCNALQFYDDPSKYPLKFYSTTINLSTIDSCMRDYLVVTPYQNIEYKSVTMDSIVHKEDSLGAELTFSIGYGFFKLGIEGSYVGHETVTNAHYHMGVAADYPALESSVDINNVIAEYDDWAETKPQNDLRKSALSPVFKLCRKNLQEACESSDENRIKRAVKDVIDRFGTGVCGGTVLGGGIVLELLVDTTKVSDKMIVNGHLTLDVQEGLLSVKANAKAGYRKEGSTFLSKTNYKVKIFGGGGDEAADLISKFSSNKLGSEAYNDSLNSSLNKWVKSIKYSDIIGETGNNYSNAMLLSADIIPIWRLFSGASSTAIKDYLIENYPYSKFMNDFE